LRRKPDVVKLALALREPQTQPVICNPAAAGVAQEARHNKVGSARQGTADAGSHMPAGRGRSCAGSRKQSSCLWQPGISRRRQSCAGQQGQKLSRNPDAVKLALAGREPQE
jgi:hypothetical protein